MAGRRDKFFRGVQIKPWFDNPAWRVEYSGKSTLLEKPIERAFIDSLDLTAPKKPLRLISPLARHSLGSLFGCGAAGKQMNQYASTKVQHHQNPDQFAKICRMLRAVHLDRMLKGRTP